MKAAFAVEAVGFESDAVSAWRLTGDHRSIRRNRPWVAELLGPCPRFGYSRQFLRPTIDYTHANNRGTRGVIYRWVLEAGYFYETRYRASWRHDAHRFLTVTSDGDVVDATEAEIAARWEEKEVRRRWESVGSELTF